MKWLLLAAIFTVLGYRIWKRRQEVNEFLDRLALFLALVMLFGAALRFFQWYTS
ncbi:MAG: hypothetical protein KC910_17290 [Candidatus Eremiobacteraeota bacterium]|nr:hypothetical protein [Candidatus Eremiobacteraeota bacterium]